MQQRQPRLLAALLLTASCLLAPAGAARTAARAQTRQPWLGDDPADSADEDRSADAALAFVHNQLSADKIEKQRLQEQVAEARGKEEDLARRLSEGRHAAEEAAQRASEALEQKGRQDAEELEAERRREQLLQGRLRNLTQAFALRGRGLAAARDVLSKARREHLQLMGELGAARGNATALAERLDRSQTALAEARQELFASRQDLDKAGRSWRQEEGEFKKEQAAQQKELAARAEALRNEEQEAKGLKEAKERQETQLRDLKREMSEAAASSEAKLAIEREKRDESQKLLEDEKKKGEQQVNLLEEALKAYEKRIGEERQQEQQLARRLAALEARQRSELANLTGRLDGEETRKRHLLEESEALQEASRANASKVEELEEEVAALRHRVEQGDEARRRAEETASKAEEGMERAQAVARQLAGTVPRLLENAQRAHEARDAEKALRTQDQASVQRQLRELKQQYASVVEGELEKASPASGSGGGELEKVSSASGSGGSEPEKVSPAVGGSSSEAEKASPAAGSSGVSDRSKSTEASWNSPLRRAGWAPIDQAEAPPTFPDQAANPGDADLAPAELSELTRPAPDLMRDSAGLDSLLDEE